MTSTSVAAESGISPLRVGVVGLGVVGLGFIDACYRSAAEGREVTV